MSKIKLPKEFRTKWLKALTNGSYKQTSSTLHSQIGSQHQYCCLGVACRISGVDISPMNGEGMPSGLDEKWKNRLPSALFGRKKNRNENSRLAKILANLNDEGKSFKEIAEYIEKHTVAG